MRDDGSTELTAADSIKGIDFTVPAELNALGERVLAFVKDEVIAYERDPRWGAHGPSDAMRLELNERARKAGVFAPHVAREFGGQALSHFGQAIVFEAAGYSMLGPIALHCAAPDEGNMHLLDVVATKEQRARYLEPLATGKVRSAFLMTEPAPGAGSDPGQMLTTARPHGNGFIINGRKWLITGADGAAFAIIMARMEGGEADGKATMFLTDFKTDGIKVERLLDTLDSSFTGGHAEIQLDGVKVGADAILGELGAGFRYAQVRLAPARLTHCMRWLGSARRAHDIAVDYARKRMAFGKPLGGHEAISFMLADNEMDMHVARLAIWHTAWVLDQGRKGGTESSMAKVICSEAIARVADRSMQILGGLGTTRDTVVERIFREVRSFRIYDGPSEVHRWSLGRRIVGQ